jgi:hypothetical protein
MRPTEVYGTWGGGDNSNPQRFWWESQKETDLLEDLFVVGSITLVRILNKQDGRVWSRIV